MRRLLIAGNWKMNTSLQTAKSLASAIATNLPALDPDKSIDVALFPPFVFIPTVVEACASTGIQVGAQTCSQHPYGAFTGEVSTDMLLSCGCNQVLVGHSERRQYYHETNDLVALKVESVLKSPLTPILCIGETLEQRQTGQTWAILQQQLDAVYSLIDASQLERIIIAYEPVWAIGTGVAASSTEAEEAHAFIRKHLSRWTNAESLRILYGGSVTADNAKELLSQPDIDGALIGGASLKAESFCSIISTAHSLR